MLKKLPIGGQDYNKLKSDNYYIVDKTMMIKTFLDSGSEVTLITRPRRFGKSLNMSMMAEFFDITKDSQELFKDTKIAETQYINYMNKYPTIFISFANANDGKMKVVKDIKNRINDLYSYYDFVFANLNRRDQIQYNSIQEELDDSDNGLLSKIGESLSFLMKQMENYYHKKVMLFIDEYDTPFIDAYTQGYYQDIKGDLAAIFRYALKGTLSLQNAMLTGVQRVAKENIFSGLNNIDVCTVCEQSYCEYFGFDSEETKTLLEYYGLELNDEVKKQYDGYHIGNTNIYNPWSVINYVKDKLLKNYWVNTSANLMIRKAIGESDRSFKSEYYKLIENGELITQVKLDTSFYEYSSTASLWGLFANAGYITIDEVISYENSKCRIRIPNKEVRSEFMSFSEACFSLSEGNLSKLLDYLVDVDYEAFINLYKDVLEIPSFYDLQSENSYHMLLLGMLLYLEGDYQIISNREQGKGRCDIILKAKRNDMASFVIEFKYTKDDKELDKLAKEAINQIEEKHYDNGLTGRIIYVGLAHCGKEVSMEWIDKD